MHKTIEEKFFDLGVKLRRNKGEQKVQCPNCAKIGKKNYKDLCLSVNTDNGLYNCHKCGLRAGCLQMIH